MATIYRYRLLIWCLLVIPSLMPGTDAQDIVVVTTTIQAATTIQATPTIPSPASYTSLDDFKDTVLEVSNEYRASHDASPLVWNETLVEYSRQWADTCLWKHSVCRLFSLLAGYVSMSQLTCHSGWPLW